MIAIYRLIHEIDQVDYSTFFELAGGNNFTRGHTLKIKKPRANSRTRQCVLGFRAVNNWNSLTNDVVTAESLNQFKTGIERLWRNKEFKFDPTAHHGQF